MSRNRIAAVLPARSLCTAILALVGWLSFAAGPLRAQQSASVPNLKSPNLTLPNPTLPNLVKFGGTLPSASGSSASVVFALYGEPTGGAPLWQEVQSVAVDASGRYTALLGSATSGGVPVDLFSSNQARWLGVAVQGATEQPRVLLVSVPYALKASDSETLGGLPASAFALAGSLGSGSNAASGAAANSTAASYVNSAAVADAIHAATTITGVAQGFVPYVSNGTTGTLSQSNLYQSIAGGNIGINNQSPAVPLHVGSATASGTQIEAEGANGSFAVVSHGNAPNSANLTFATVSNGTLAGDELGQIGGLGSYPGGAGTGSTSAKEVFQAAATFATGSTPGEILWYTTPAGSTSHQQRMILDQNGRLGIGTATPGAPLEVNGNIKLSTSSAGQIVFPDGSTLGTANAVASVGGNNTFTGDETFDGVVGMNTTAPTAALEVDTNSAAASQNYYTSIFGEVPPLSSTGLAETGYYVGVWGDMGGPANEGEGVLGTADDNYAAIFNNSSSDTSGGNYPALIAINSETVDTVSPVFETYANPTYVNPSNPGTPEYCSIDVSGNLYCTGTFNGVSITPATSTIPAQAAAIHAVQSPENWIEDFGSGALGAGTATVTLDPAFARTVNTGMAYHVFLTPTGDCKGLYVTQKSANSFVVRELGGGRSTVGFDFRIVAKRAGFESARLEDMTPQVKRMMQNQQRLHMPARASGQDAAPGQVGAKQPALAH